MFTLKFNFYFKRGVVLKSKIIAQGRPIMKRVAVIGLDGVSWPIIKKIFKRNAMPTLKSIYDKSLKCILESTIPPYTPTAWTSIATGVNPGKHGIYDFLHFTPSLEAKVHTSNDVRYPRVHEMVALKGIKSVCVNQPLTYPIIPLKNTAVISDWLSPKPDYFPGWMSNYAISYAPHKISLETIYTDELLEGLRKECSLRVKSLIRIAEETDWKLFWVVISEPDMLLHRCYHMVLEGNEAVDEILRRIDDLINTVSRLADSLIVVSDHGFSSFKRIIHVNTLLYNMGFVVKTRRKVHQLSDLRLKAKVKRIRIPGWLYRVVSIKPIKKAIKMLYRAVTGYELKAEPYMYVDMEKSKAYMASHSSFGVVVKDPKLVPEIIRILKDTGLFSEVWSREEVYSGPYVSSAPDILILPHYDKGYSIGSIYISNKVVEDKTTYNHHPEGIFMMYPHDGGWAGRIKAVDVAPTILSLLSLPLPPDVDGHSLVKTDTGRFDYLKRWNLLRKILAVRIKYLTRGLQGHPNNMIEE